MSLLATLREIGLPMGGSYRPNTVATPDESGELVEVTTRLHVGWTTDPEKAEAARNAGATVTAYTSANGNSGWEVSVREVVDA